MGNCNKHLPELDTRTIETSYCEKPFCYLGRIDTSFNNHSNGILINHNVVLTSSFILHHPITNELINPNQIKFSLVQKERKTQIRIVNVSEYYIHNNEKMNHIHQFSWCLLFLSEPIGLDLNRMFYKAKYYKICVW